MYCKGKKEKPKVIQDSKPTGHSKVDSAVFFYDTSMSQSGKQQTKKSQSSHFIKELVRNTTFFYVRI